MKVVWYMLKTLFIRFIWLCYLAWIKIVWYMLKTLYRVWPTVVFVVSWCLLELAWGLVLIVTWIGLNIYCYMTRSVSPPPTTVESSSTPHANVSPRATRDITVVSYVATSTTTPVGTAGVIAATRPTNTVRNISDDSCLLATTKDKSSSVGPQFCQSTTIGTLAGKAINKPCTTKHGSSTVSESLPSLPPSSLPAVTKIFTETSPSAPVASPRRQSLNTRPVARLIDSEVTSSVSSTQNDNTTPASDITVCDPTKHAPVSAVRSTVMQYNSNCTSIQVSANVHSSYQYITVAPEPDNSASEATHIKVLSAEPSNTLSFPSTTIPRAAAPASKFRDVSVTSDRAVATAVENITIKRDRPNICSPVTTHEETVKNANIATRYALDSYSTNGKKVSVIASSSSSSCSSSLLSHHGINAQSNCNVTSTTTVHISATTNTVRNTSANSCLVTTTKAVIPEVCQSTTVGTLTGKAVDKPCTTKHDSSTVSKSLPSLPPSSLPAVTVDKRFAATSSSAPVAAPRRQSSNTRPVVTLTDSEVTSPVCTTQNDNTTPASNITVCIPTKHAPVSAARPIAMQYTSNCTSIQATANGHGNPQLVTVAPQPVSSTSEAARITVRNVRVIQSAEPSNTLSFPSTTIPRAAAPASKFQDISVTSDRAVATAVENITVKRDNICSAPVTTHEETVKYDNTATRYTLDSSADNVEKVSLVAPSSASSSSSLLSRHIINAQSNYCDSASTATMPLYTASTSTTQTDKHSKFPLSDEYEFRLVCDVCFKPKSELMLSERNHSCRQDMLAVKRTIGTNEWRWIRQRDASIKFKGDYAMCNRYQYGTGNSCYYRCSYAHCDAERRLWDMEKKSTFSVTKFISAHQTSAPICSVKTILDKYPVSTIGLLFS